MANYYSTIKGGINQYRSIICSNKVVSDTFNN